MSISPTPDHAPEPDLEVFLGELESLLNRHSIDNWVGTPDFILAKHLLMTLHAHRDTVARSCEWHGWRPLSERLNRR